VKYKGSLTLVRVNPKDELKHEGLCEEFGNTYRGPEE